MASTDTVLYRASFPSGFRPLVSRLLERDYGNLESSPSLEADESSALFRAPPGLKTVPYLQALSLVIDRIAGSNLEKAYRTFASRLSTQGPVQTTSRQSLLLAQRGGKSGSARSFALRALDQGEPSSVSRSERGALEAAIQAATGMRPDSEHPELELQVSLRSGGEALFQMAVRASATGKTEKGELPPSTCRLLLELAGCGKEDVLLDPFMGSGAILFERARMGPYRMLFCGDAEDELVDRFKEKLKDKAWEKRRKTIFPKLLDARDLSRFEDGFFTCIVTDPPWGNFGKTSEEELESLYSAFLCEARRVLAEHGTLVLLVGRDSPLDAPLAREEGRWQLREDYRVLISGRKARALLLEAR